MILFCIDESGNRDPRLKIPRANSSTLDGDPIYVLTAISLFEHRWHGFEKTLNRRKNWLLAKIAREQNLRLDWSQSNAAARPFRGIHIFPGNSPLTALVDAFEKERAGVPANPGSNMVSGGANPIEPTSGTGQKND